MATPWPFFSWVMDVIRPINAKDSNGQQFDLVAMYYFTEWVDSITFKACTKKLLMDFFRSYIICRFGISRCIITNNVANLNIN